MCHCVPPFDVARGTSPLPVYGEKVRVRGGLKAHPWNNGIVYYITAPICHGTNSLRP
jgi:hypothetical protein